MAKLIDLTGKKYGRLTVVKRAGSQGKNTTWLCICDCGTECIVQSSNLKNQKNISCGCNRRQLASKKFKTHGMAKTRLYREWRRMKERCLLQTKEGYERYGGRGITVCAEWSESFEAFRDWAMANGYRDDLTLDRKDNDGPYCPENCRWITNAEQQSNKSNNRFITFDGRTQTLSQWARETGIRKDTLRLRLKKGWSVERALTEPIHEARRPKH